MKIVISSSSELGVEESVRLIREIQAAHPHFTAEAVADTKVHKCEGCIAYKNKKRDEMCHECCRNPNYVDDHYECNGIKLL